MRSSDFFTAKKQPSKNRKNEVRVPKPNSFLIVTEGEKTEPSYFDGLANYINTNHGKSIDLEKPEIKTCGEGKCTVGLVRATEKIVSRSKILYNHIWVVFDKDDFTDFDEAIELGKKNGFEIAWSNQSFEYWLYLHFNYSDSALHRSEWEEKLNEIFKKKKITSKGYQKNLENLFDLCTSHGSLKKAIENAKKIESHYDDTMPPSKCDPCTKVHSLVQELEPYIEELIK